MGITLRFQRTTGNHLVTKRATVIMNAIKNQISFLIGLIPRNFLLCDDEQCVNLE